MVTTLTYLILCGLVVLFLTTGFGYSEAEEMTSMDKSPKHHLIWTFKNKITLTLVSLFIFAAMVM